MPKHTCRGDGTTPLPWWGPPRPLVGTPGRGTHSLRIRNSTLGGLIKKRGRGLSKIISPGFHSPLVFLLFFSKTPLFERISGFGKIPFFWQIFFLPNFPFLPNSPFCQFPFFAKSPFLPNSLFCQIFFFAKFSLFCQIPFFCQNSPFY
ncbi:hypothetical protein, unlikely [Trypanosoma congolense IL3000]|uniref:Uncharacterized protein n=1 Tax=Trypanosoma congolense (strain IL3000) TaxID=1068625 RepID=F9WFT0_TRYCI|nr:hypothetical protein, unlikely [Trypanosoma congolense IL3000]